MLSAFVGCQGGRVAVVGDRRVLRGVHLDVGAERRGGLTRLNERGVNDVSKRIGRGRGRLLSMEVKCLRLGMAVTVGKEFFKD